MQNLLGDQLRKVRDHQKNVYHEYRFRNVYCGNKLHHHGNENLAQKMKLFSNPRFKGISKLRDNPVKFLMVSSLVGVSNQNSLRLISHLLEASLVFKGVFSLQ